jgi:hypothetical protein
MRARPVRYFVVIQQPMLYNFVELKMNHEISVRVVLVDTSESVACAACGRPLPQRQGKGRRRRYCDARCRDAARRARVRSGRRADPNVNESLTTESRQDYVYGIEDVPENGDPLAARVGDTARRLVRALDGSGTVSPLDVVTAARELSAAAADALQAAVDRARAAGHSWREIGDVLDTTRQAAFQRFGRPVDPRTGTLMNQQIVPGAPERALAIAGCIIAGRWEQARRDFDPKMLEVVDAALIAAGWAQTIGEIGQYERMGEPVAYQTADITVVDIPLHFEAGDRTLKTSLNRDGQVVGLFIRPPA